MERVGYNRLREPVPVEASPHLQGTSRDSLTLHIEFMGPTARVLEDVREAIARLQWFEQQLEQKSTSQESKAS